jgi:hypothetical protein
LPDLAPEDADDDVSEMSVSSSFSSSDLKVDVTFLPKLFHLRQYLVGSDTGGGARDDAIVGRGRRNARPEEEASPSDAVS